MAVTIQPIEATKAKTNRTPQTESITEGLVYQMIGSKVSGLKKVYAMTPDTTDIKNLATARLVIRMVNSFATHAP